MFRSILLAGLLPLLVASRVAAQPPGATFPATRYRDPASATVLSAAFTVLPTLAGIAIAASDPESGAGALLFMGGLTLGPAMGYFSTGRIGRGMAGFGIRTGVFIGTIAAGFGICGWTCTDSQQSTAAAVVLGGLTLTTALAVYDIAKVRRKLPAATASRVSVYPTYVAATKSPGIGIGVTF